MTRRKKNLYNNERKSRSWLSENEPIIPSFFVCHLMISKVHSFCLTVTMSTTAMVAMMRPTKMVRLLHKENEWCFEAWLTWFSQASLSLSTISEQTTQNMFWCFQNKAFGVCYECSRKEKVIAKGSSKCPLKHSKAFMFSASHMLETTDFTVRTTFLSVSETPKKPFVNHRTWKSLNR